MPAGGVEVGGGLAGRSGGEVGQEQRALLAAGQVPGQQPGGAGSAVWPVALAASTASHASQRARSLGRIGRPGHDRAGRPRGRLGLPACLRPGSGVGRERALAGRLPPSAERPAGVGIATRRHTGRFGHGPCPQSPALLLNLVQTASATDSTCQLPKSSARMTELLCIQDPWTGSRLPRAAGTARGLITRQRRT
jgi:hypothetical protein